MGSMLHGTAVVLRPALPDDGPRFAAVLSTPEVSRWWTDVDPEHLEQGIVGSTDAVVYAIEYEDDVVGAVLYIEEPARNFRHASLDVFLDPRIHGQGLGTDAVRTLARHLIHDRGHHRLVLYPDAENEQAIKTFNRVGFRPVGVMRQFERHEDGEWRDCLLMDLLEPDLN